MLSYGGSALQQGQKAVLILSYGGSALQEGHEVELCAIAFNLVVQA